MQKLNITKSFILSAECTLEILREVALKCLHCTDAAINKLAGQPLKGASKDVEKLDHPKLRTVILTKFGNDNCEYGAKFASGELFVSIDHLPDLELDMGKAGENTKKTSAKRASKLAGAYVVVKARDMSGDEGKQAIWKFVWECSTFEDFFAKAPGKSVTSKTGRLITASSEIQWAVKSGWIKPVAA